MTSTIGSNQLTVKDTSYLDVWRDSSTYHPDLPSFKRCIELYVYDQSFQQSYLLKPAATLSEYGFPQINPLELDIIVNHELAIQYPEGGEKLIPELVHQYRQFIKAKQRHCCEIRDDVPLHPIWHQWRERMVKATLWRDGPVKYRKLVHAPFTIELTHGCTVGCWFCGVDAERFQGPVEVSDDVIKFWRQLLQAFKSIGGEHFSQHGFCYWATDPLDHPQYEAFLEHFHEIIGYWPQTTTAQVLKHAPRFRRLLKTLESKNAFIQRFSMTRATDLKAIFDFFTPEELFLCEMIPQYDDKLSPKATAGRVRKIVLNKKEKEKPISFQYDLESTGSIACVSGFLINLVQHSIKLITPCAASDKWPLGYRILGEYNYQHTENIETILRLMLDHCINNRLLPDDQLKFIYGVDCSSAKDSSLSVSSHGYAFVIKEVQCSDRLSELLRSGEYTVDQICHEIENVGGSRIQTLIALHQLFEQGVFDEDLLDSARPPLPSVLEL